MGEEGENRLVLIWDEMIFLNSLIRWDRIWHCT